MFHELPAMRREVFACLVELTMALEG